MQKTKKARRKKVLKGMRRNNFHGVYNGHKLYPSKRRYSYGYW